MQLEARALEPLDSEHAIARVLCLWVGERQAEQRQALGLAHAAPPVELQAVSTPGAQDRIANVVAGLGKEAAAWLGRALGKGEPVAALLLEAIGTQPAKQHVVGARVLGVQFQAVALEPLHLNRPAPDLLLAPWANWVGEG